MQIEIANHANLNFYILVFYIELHSLQTCSGGLTPDILGQAKSIF